MTIVPFFIRITGIKEEQLIHLIMITKREKQKIPKDLLEAIKLIEKYALTIFL